MPYEQPGRPALRGRGLRPCVGTTLGTAIGAPLSSRSGKALCSKSAGSSQPPPVVRIAQIWRSASTSGRLCRVRLPLPDGGEARGRSRRSGRSSQGAATPRSGALPLRPDRLQQPCKQRRRRDFPSGGGAAISLARRGPPLLLLSGAAASSSLLELDHGGGLGVSFSDYARPC